METSFTPQVSAKDLLIGLRPREAKEMTEQVSTLDMRKRYQQQVVNKRMMEDESL